MLEAEFRGLLAGHIDSKFGQQARFRVIHELALPQQGARVDIAVVADYLIGFEIKTASDDLTRLPQQQLAYGQVFDRMFIAVEPKHLARVLETVPNWWGVLEAQSRAGRIKFTQRRPSRLNPDTSLHALVQLLWRDEVLDELRELGLERGLRGAPRQELWRRLAEASPSHIKRRDLKANVRARLKSREGWRAD